MSDAPTIPVPTETVLVPAKPSKDMIRAGMGEITGGSTFDRQDRCDIAKDVYRAMLAAAPTLSCEDQHAAANRIAANIGMVLVTEPEHPDAPGPGGFERAAEAAFARSGTDTATVTADDYRAASPALASPVPSDAGVMRLEWEEPTTGPDQYSYIGRDGSGQTAYEIVPLGDHRRPTFRVLRLNRTPRYVCDCSFDTVEKSIREAKVKAQSDFAAYIRSCLVPSGGKDQEALAGEVERLTYQLSEARKVQRWNVEPSGEGRLAVCMDEHEKGEPCEWVEFVPASALDAERAAHERTFWDVGEATEGAKHLHAERDEARARIALLEETVETAGKALEPFAKAADIYDHDDTWKSFADDPAAHGRGTIRVSTLRAARDAFASLTQHKAPALPASDAEGGANG